MADNKQNQGFYISDENWDKNRARYNDDNNYKRQSNYNPNQMDLDRDGNLGNTGGFYGGTNYMGASGIDYGQDWNHQNKKQHDRNYQEYQGYGYQSKSDYNQNFQQQGDRGNQRYDQQYNRNTQQRRQDYSQQYNDYDNRRQQQNDHYRQSSNQQQQQNHPSYYGHVAGFRAIDDVANQQHHSNSGFQNRDWDDHGNRSRQHDYNNMNRNRNMGRSDERNWWDKTRDEVSSWFGDTNAERRRRQDERREGEFKGRGPKEYRRSDDRIREDVCDRLSEDSYIDASDIEVEVLNGEVTLNGKVDNRNTKRRAEDIIEAISGVSHVQNNLRVGQSMPASSSTSNSASIDVTRSRTDNDLNANK